MAPAKPLAMEAQKLLFPRLLIPRLCEFVISIEKPHVDMYLNNCVLRTTSSILAWGFWLSVGCQTKLHRFKVQFIFVSRTGANVFFLILVCSVIMLTKQSSCHIT